MIPITRTSVRVEWTPLFPESWSGDLSSGGYKIQYRQIVNNIPTSLDTEVEVLKDVLAKNVVLENLEVSFYLCFCSLILFLLLFLAITILFVKFW